MKYYHPCDYVTEDMIKRNRDVLDDWHFAQNINAMMQQGYCKKCGLVPVGCKREGCGAIKTTHNSECTVTQSEIASPKLTS